MKRRHAESFVANVERRTCSRIRLRSLLQRSCVKKEKDSFVGGRNYFCAGAGKNKSVEKFAISIALLGRLS